jgi:hypothetical protein
VHACHIVPQCFGDEEYRRICRGSDRNEPANLLLLTPTLHTAFDRFMFGFAPTGRGTHAVEVYVSDPELDRHDGKIVRLASGDVQLAAHRAACRHQGRSVGSQERHEDFDWDARTTFRTACEDVRPTKANAQVPDVRISTTLDQGAFAIAIARLVSAERSGRKILSFDISSEWTDLLTAIYGLGSACGIVLPSPRSYTTCLDGMPDNFDVCLRDMDKYGEEMQEMTRSMDRAAEKRASDEAKEKEQALCQARERVFISETNARHSIELDYLRDLDVIWKEQSVDMTHVALPETLGGFSIKLGRHVANKFLEKSEYLKKIVGYRAVLDDLGSEDTAKKAQVEERISRYERKNKECDDEIARLRAIGPRG